MGATYFVVEDIEFPDEAASPTAPRGLVEEAQRSGARRKYLARGEGGFFSQVSWFPAGYTVPMHRHDHDELIMVVEGSLTMLGEGGPTLRALDSMVLTGGHEYGFTAGPDGMTITTVRTAPSAATLT
ncbi:MAG: hypothetical protein JWO77_829 [Ilumatobacteraceae bacterium]|nr:hypothetical protein [Ilumatobacteraceae bacterium]